MRFFVASALALGLLLQLSAAPSRSAGPAIDASARHEVLATAIRELKDQYVYADRAAAAAAALSAAEQAGAFDTMTDPEAFAKAVTETLAQTLHDKHLHVEYSAELVPRNAPDKPTPAQIARRLRFYRSVNFGIEKAMRLPSNVGYLDIRGFPPAPMMADTLAAAMKLLSNTDALIIDLRQNGGGSPEAVTLLCSYLFPPGVHINDLYFRTPKTTSGKTQQFWTKRVAPAPYAKKIYVLTSADTFSGGEEFAYDVQTHKRATLVGENTGGGANPGGQVRLSDHFQMFLPTGRAVNPITHTNWEGVGVKPDVATAPDAALATAYLTLLREKRAAEADPQRQKDDDDLIASITKDPRSIFFQ